MQLAFFEHRYNNNNFANFAPISLKHLKKEMRLSASSPNVGPDRSAQEEKGKEKSVRFGKKIHPLLMESVRKLGPLPLHPLWVCDP